MQPAHPALHPNRKAVTCTPAARRALVVITCSHRPSQHTGINQLLARCASNVHQLWTATAALQQQHLHNSKQHNWHQSLGIGAGVSAAALSGSGGGYGPPGSSSWGSGGGGSGWGPSYGSSSGAGSNVLADVAAAGDVADAAVEEVILLDIGGELLFHLHEVVSLNVPACALPVDKRTRWQGQLTMVKPVFYTCSPNS